MSVRAYRAAMIAGAATAVLLFVGSGFLYGPTPDTSNKSADEVSAKWLNFLNDSGDRHQVIIGSFVIVLAALTFIWFASALRARLDPGGPMAGFAMLAAVGLAAGMLGPLALVGGTAFGDDPLINDGNVVWMVFNISFPAVLVMFGLGMAAFLVAVAIKGRGVLPTWLIVITWIAVLGGIFGVIFLPMGLIILWLLIAGIYGAIRPGGDAAPAATSPSAPVA